MLTWLKTLTRRMAISKPRRRVRRRIVFDAVECCEARAYLSGGFTIPGSGEVLTDPGEPTAVATDFSGEWRGGFDDLQLSYANGKVTGKYSGLAVVGEARVKGKADGLQMTAVIRGRGLSPVYGLGRFKISLNVSLTDADHFEGTMQVVFAGHDLGNHAVQFRRA